eukprot:gene43596-54161_t
MFGTCAADCDGHVRRGDLKVHLRVFQDAVVSNKTKRNDRQSTSAVDEAPPVKKRRATVNLNNSSVHQMSSEDDEIADNMSVLTFRDDDHAQSSHERINDGHEADASSNGSGHDVVRSEPGVVDRAATTTIMPEQVRARAETDEE